MFKLASIVVALLSLAACQSNSDTAAPQTTGAIQNRIPENTVREIYNSCVANTRISKTQSYCNCVSRAIGNRLSVEQLVEAGNSPTSPASGVVQTLRQQCLAQVGGLS